MSHQKNLEHTTAAISSQASEFGTEHSIKPDGPAQSGQAPALASLSARQAKAAGLLMSGTCGPRSSTLSDQTSLSESLASRFRAKTALLGSTLYKLTWKVRTTPLGRLIPALRASVLRTSAKDFIGWPTPQTHDVTKRGNTEADHHHMPHDLSNAAVLSGWNSPAASDGNGGKRPHPETSMTGKAPDGRKVNMGLASQAHIGFTGTEPARLTVCGEMLIGSSAGMQNGGQLSPRHSLWLMLGPIATAWLNCAERVTRSISRKRKPSSKQ